MIKRNVGAFLEADAEQAGRGIEGGEDQLVELQIGFDLGIVEVEAFGPHLFGIETPVPGRDLDIVAACRRELLQIGLFGRGARLCRRPDGIEQRAHGLRRLRHDVVEFEMGEARIAEEFRAFGAKLDHLGDERTVVGRAVVLAA